MLKFDRTVAFTLHEIIKFANQEKVSFPSRLKHRTKGLNQASQDPGNLW